MQIFVTMIGGMLPGKKLTIEVEQAWTVQKLIDAIDEAEVLNRGTKTGAANAANIAVVEGIGDRFVRIKLRPILSIHNEHIMIYSGDSDQLNNTLSSIAMDTELTAQRRGDQVSLKDLKTSWNQAAELQQRLDACEVALKQLVQMQNQNGGGTRRSKKRRSKRRRSR